MQVACRREMRGNGGKRARRFATALGITRRRRKDEGGRMKDERRELPWQSNRIPPRLTRPPYPATRSKAAALLLSMTIRPQEREPRAVLGRMKAEG